MNGNNEYGITGDKLPTHRQDLVINSLAIDLIEKRLYWSSSDDIDHITSCNYEGGAKILYNGLPRGFTVTTKINNIFCGIRLDSLKDVFFCILLYLL